MKIKKSRDGTYYWVEKYRYGITGNYYDQSDSYFAALLNYWAWRVYLFIEWIMPKRGNR